jgi:hypothetical protein
MTETMYPLPTSVAPLERQPVQFVDEVCGIYFRSIILERAGQCVPQHVHDHDHATFVGSGKARVWIDGEWDGDYTAGHAIAIKADKKHVFQALEDNTLLACVHDVASAESVKRKGA